MLELIDDMFNCLEFVGIFICIDFDVCLSMMYGVIIFDFEFEQLWCVKNVICNCCISCIELNQILFDNGELLDSDFDMFFVDCLVCVVGNLEEMIIFVGDIICLQIVCIVQLVFSVVFIVYIEFICEIEEEKNCFCMVVLLLNYDMDWICMQVVFMMNQYNWFQEKDLCKWFLDN